MPYSGLNIFLLDAGISLLSCALIEKMNMARLFTINFNYQEKEYTALISESAASDGRKAYTVSIYEEALQDLLPEGKLCFNQISELEARALRQPSASELMHSLSTALHSRFTALP